MSLLVLVLHIFVCAQQDICKDSIILRPFDLIRLCDIDNHFVLDDIVVEPCLKLVSRFRHLGGDGPV